MVVVILVSSPTAVHSVQAGISRSIPIKVVLVGIGQDQVDPSYLAWSGDSKNLPPSVVNVDLLSGNATGVVFHPQYTFTFASADFKQNLINYVRTLEKPVHGKNPWFGQYAADKSNPDYVDRNPVDVDYVVYDANSVEDWLWSHSQDLGGFSDNGWTIIVANLPELPSITWKDVQNFEKSNGGLLPKSKPHYYGITHTDLDLGYKYRYRDLMNAWGGHHRMWFVDLSAGPVWNSQWTDLPLQVVIGDNKFDIASSFGKTWFTEYIADYVWEATYNFITQNFVYFPQYAPKYQIDVFILDDRTPEEKHAVPINSTVNKDAIQAAFNDLVPYSTVTVNLDFPEVPAQLHDLIQSSYKFTDSWLMGADFASPERYGIVDLRPVYKYMTDNFASFEKSGRHAHSDSFGLFDPSMVDGTVIIPAFAFAFSNETYFSYTYKWFIGDTDYENGALLGIALSEGAFISYNQYLFTRGGQVSPPQTGKGEGFTQTIIHEVGHEFGLMHPHQYGDIGDFILSPMGYFTDDYQFGIIDKDSVQRAHADQLYMDSLRLISGSSAGGLVSQTMSKLAEVDAAYSQMRYSDAVQAALSAHQLAVQAAQSGGGQTTQTGPTTQTTTTGPTAAADMTIVYLVVGVIIGVVVGFGLAMILRRRKTA
jgi:hypothetical protein